MIVIVGTSPPFGLKVSQQVENKRKSTSPGFVGQSQKLDAVVDGNFPHDLHPALIFSKVIGHKLSGGSSWDLNVRFRMNFAADTVQTQTPQLMDLGFSTINALDESNGLGTLSTRILRYMDVAHWSAPNHVFGETTAVGVSEEKFDYDYNYKTGFQICKENN